MLQIYDSLSRTKKPFVPLQPGEISMYLCGITVYDHCHIGHARTAVFFDVLFRYFQAHGYKVNYVRNITDIDDKIINKAVSTNSSWQEVTTTYIDAMHEDYDRLGILRPTLEPKATESITQIIDMIQCLLDKGTAYQADNGDVYYDTTQFKDYGLLAQQDLESLQAGSRIDVAEQKRNPLDFVLWKMAKPNEPKWQSPWGDGRPGWHIECSAMSSCHLGQTLDIHGGGNDLKFPHHENERAQSEAVSGQHFVNHWMHVGFVNINDEKMSKSLKNFFTIRDVLKEYDAEVIRYFLLSSHYRSPVNYSHDNLQQAQNCLRTLYTALRDVKITDVQPIVKYQEAFEQALADDFNLPQAIAVLFELAKEINKHKANCETEKAIESASYLRQLAGMLGICQKSPEAYLQGEVDDAQAIDALIAERNQARADKNWARADEIRQQLAEMDIVIEDSAGGTSWRRA